MQEYEERIVNDVAHRRQKSSKSETSDSYFTWISSVPVGLISAGVVQLSYAKHKTKNN
jgi:hypothetical protein